MDYYKTHDMDAQELKAQLMHYLSYHDLSPWVASQRIKIDKRSFDKFILNPESSKYKTVMLINNWINEQKAKYGGQESI